MSSYLKKSLFTLLILMMPYMNSTSKAMDTEDHEGSTIRARKVSFVTEDQRDVSSSVKQSTSYQVVSLEDSQTSLASYMTSPIKATMQMTSQFMEIATNNPKLAIAIGFLYIMPAIAATCDCVCSGSHIGNEPSVAQCIADCKAIGKPFTACNPF
jgi:hypothetical protein